MHVLCYNIEVSLHRYMLSHQPVLFSVLM